LSESFISSITSVEKRKHYNILGIYYTSGVMNFHLMIRNILILKKKIIIVAINVLLIISIANAMLSGSHDLYKSGVDPQSFCSKCHSASAVNVTLSEHKLINCTCHGYNPSSNVKYNVNMKHDLTRNIYCTNCHSRYDETTGNIAIHNNISGLDQSAHYIIKSTDAQLYNNTRGFFE
jgi:hypothetical protein